MFSKKNLIAISTILIVVLITTALAHRKRNNNSQSENRNELKGNFFQKNSIIDDKAQLNWFGENITFWKPTMKDIELAEKVIHNEIKLKKNEDWNILNEENLDRYYKQYSFIITEKKDSIIFVNAFCRIPEIPTDSSGIMIIRKFDWRKKLLRVLDGGDCFWNATINKSNCEDAVFIVNGNA